MSADDAVKMLSELPEDDDALDEPPTAVIARISWRGSADSSATNPHLEDVI